MIALVVTVMALAAPLAVVQEQDIGQEGAVWNLGELAPGAYPSTVTAANKSCPGDHDFHVSLGGEAAEFIIITGPTILTDVPPGGSKTSDIVVDLRSMAPGPHNGGTLLVRCVDCPPNCTQDYDVLAVNVSVSGDASSAPADAPAGTGRLWTDIDLTLLDSTMASPDATSVRSPADGESRYRWVLPTAFAATTLVQDAVAAGTAELAFTGTRRAAGDIFSLEITRNAPTPFEMSFRLGTVFVPDDPSYSPMMLADDGAVALLDELTVVRLPGYMLDPTLALAPAGAPSGGGTRAPTWSVVAPPESGELADAVGVIHGAIALAGTFDNDMESNAQFRAVTQRAIWFVNDAVNFGKPKLEQDIAAQVAATDGSQNEEEVQELADGLWDDITRAINEGKSGR